MTEPKEKTPKPKKDDDKDLEEGPTKPGRRRFSDWGVGGEHSTPAPIPDHSPTSKTP
jgi:hypothetical protein